MSNYTYEELRETGNKDLVDIILELQDENELLIVINIDIANDSEEWLDELLESLNEYELTLIKCKLNGPAGGWPSPHIQGTQENILNWRLEYYDDGCTAQDFLETHMVK